MSSYYQVRGSEIIGGAVQEGFRKFLYFGALFLTMGESEKEGKREGGKEGVSKRRGWSMDKRARMRHGTWPGGKGGASEVGGRSGVETVRWRE